VEHKGGGKWDLAGGVLSLICALHCLALPVLLPFAAVFVHSLWLEIALMASAVIVGSHALRHGFKMHQFRTPAWLFGIGMVSILVGNWVLTHGEPLGTHGPNEHVQTLPSIILVFVGGALVMSAHVLNYVWERRWVARNRHD
jgi:hypothetical protein